MEALIEIEPTVKKTQKKDKRIELVPDETGLEQIIVPGHGWVHHRTYGDGAYIHKVKTTTDGEAGKVLDALEQYARSKELSFVEVDVDPADLEEKAFYESQGYRGKQDFDTLYSVEGYAEPQPIPCITYRKAI